MKRILLTVGILFGMQVNADAPSLLIDEDYKKEALELKETTVKACEALKPDPSKWLTCFEEKYEQADASGNLRGTKAYMDKHYASLSLSDAERKREQLKKLLALAEKEQRFSMNTKPEKGELNTDLLVGEIIYLNKIIKAQKPAKPSLADEAEALGAPQMADRIRKLVKPAE